jgi:hypothetical protein
MLLGYGPFVLMKMVVEILVVGSLVVGGALCTSHMAASMTNVNCVILPRNKLSRELPVKSITMCGVIVMHFPRMDKSNFENAY